MMAAAFDAPGAEPTFGKPVALFTDEYDFGGKRLDRELRRDSRRAVHHAAAGTQGGRLRAVINWTEELKQVLAAGGSAERTMPNP